MTTIIFECPKEKMKNFGDQELIQLMKIYGYEDLTIDWIPEYGTRKNHLIFTELPLLAMSYIPLDGVKKVHFDDAMQRLIEFEAKHATPINAQECLKLAAMLIETDLQSDDTPEHQKGDLRCMRAIIDTLNRHAPIDHENKIRDIKELQINCINKMSVMSCDIHSIYNKAAWGVYHQPRNTKPEQLEETA